MVEKSYLIELGIEEVEALIAELDKFPLEEGVLLDLKEALLNFIEEEEEVDYSNLESFWYHEKNTARELMESAAPLSEFMSELWLVSFEEVRKKLFSLKESINSPEFDAYAEKLLVELQKAEEEDRLLDEFLEGDFS